MVNSVASVGAVVSDNLMLVRVFAETKAAISTRLVALVIFVSVSFKPVKTGVAATP